MCLFSALSRRVAALQIPIIIIIIKMHRVYVTKMQAIKMLSAYITTVQGIKMHSAYVTKIQGIKIFFFNNIFHLDVHYVYACSAI